MKKAVKIISILLVLSVVLCLTGCKVEMTEEERQAYIKANTHEYEVVSVHQYIKTQTTRYGHITSQEPRYTFTYIGGDGQLHQESDFYHTEYGLWRVCLGEENKYVETTDGVDTYKYLYLTKETLANMDSLNGGVK